MYVTFIPPAHSGTTVSCLFEQNDCVVDYDVVLSGPNNIIVSVYVGEERGMYKAIR